MTKGKYQRKRERAEEQRNQEQANIPLRQEGSYQLDTANAKDRKEGTANENQPSWYGRLWKRLKAEPITAITITVFTCALTLASIFQGCMTRGQLTAMQLGQRPFVFATISNGNDWTKDSEHDMKVTMGVQNTSSFPAVSVKSSVPKLEMGTRDTIEV